MAEENLTHILFESSSGYALFERVESEEIGGQLAQVQEKLLDPSRFSKTVHLVAFAPFKSASEALENQNDISEGLISPFLKAFLEMNLPKTASGGEDKKKGKKSKAPKATLGVVEKNLASTIKSGLGINCVADDVVFELHRLLRHHAATLLKSLKPHDLEKSQLGLGHAYSRAKVKFNVNRVDNMIIQAIALLDQLDKDINTFAMRVREWYGWHFPELVKLVNENRTYCRVVTVLRNKGTFNETTEWNKLLEAVEQDETKARQILEAVKSSMGTDISEIDLINIENFANRVLSLTSYRARLQGYLQEKMNNIAPNLSALIGEVIGARLISHAGSLTNLSKYPASTVQILGAEKALFRALKTRGNTPKYGLIYNSSFIGKAGQKNKGRISRFLANKCSIASRIDCFTDQPTDKFGKALRELVDNRLAFYEKGEAPSKNADTMQKVISELSHQQEEVAAGGKRTREEDVEEEEEEEDVEEEEEEEDDSSNKKKKKEKKSKKEESSATMKKEEEKKEKGKKEKKKQKSKDN